MTPSMRPWGLVLLLGCGGAGRDLPVLATPAARASTVPSPCASKDATNAAPSDAPTPDAVAFEEALTLYHRHDANADGALARFAQDWPHSSRLPDAYVARADLAFEAAGTDPKRLQEARQHYQAALAIPPPENRVWGYAAYKLAYVFWNTGDHRKALAALKDVIELGARYPDLDGAAKLRDTALRDFAPLFAEVGPPERARALFTTLAGDEAKVRAMLVLLATTYDEHGKHAEARSVFAELKVWDVADACVYEVRARHAVPNKNRAAEELELANCASRSGP